MKNTVKNTILFIFFLITFILFFANIEKINIPYFKGVYKNVEVDLILKNNDVPNVFYDGKKAKNILKIDNNHYLISQNYNQRVNRITFDKTENIKKLMVFIGNDVFFPDIKKEIEVNNSKDILSSFSIMILSFFYNPQFYFISYILLFIYLIKYKISLNSNLYIVSLLILAFILRISSINSIPFWDDEIYSIVITDGGFLNTFKDPGNPPLYFIYLKLFKTLIHSESFYRFSSVIPGLIFNALFYIYFKKTTDKKTAILALLISTINIILIYYSQELRSYMLLMIFTTLNALFLFNYKNKNKIYYFLSSIGLLYTHFYGSFLFLYNFIFGIFYLSRKRIKTFIFSNLLSGLIFFPIILFKKESIVSNFNSWIGKPSLYSSFILFKTFSGTILGFLIFAILCVFGFKFVKKRKLKTFLKYNFFAIIFVFAGAIVFSFLIKPIFFYKYFYVVFPMYLGLITFFAAYFVRRFKFGVIISFIVVLFLGLYQRLNEQNLFCNHNLYLKFIQQDIDYKKNNYIFMSSTVQGYKKFENMFNNKNVKIKYFPINTGLNDINPSREDVKFPFTAYILNLYLTDEAINKAETIILYRTPLGVFLKADYK